MLDTWITTWIIITLIAFSKMQCSHPCLTFNGVEIRERICNSIHSYTERSSYPWPKQDGVLSNRYNAKKRPKVYKWNFLIKIHKWVLATAWSPYGCHASWATRFFLRSTTFIGYFTMCPPLLIWENMRTLWTIWYENIQSDKLIIMPQFY